jgi:uncharacterized SAM-binding protein YcdF (DUF218 family)
LLRAFGKFGYHPRMFYFVSKFLEKFIWPESLSLLFLFVSLLIARRNRKWSVGLAAGAFFILFFSSLPIVARALMGPLERYYPSAPSDHYPVVDAIVVLGGSTSPLQNPRFEAEEMTGSRVLPAARLYRAGKAKWVLASGGVPYQDRRGKERTIAEDIADLLIDFDVPPSAILRQSRSRNTREDARESAAMLKAKNLTKILLVTSAFHQRRAVRLFEREGMIVVPVPTGPEVTEDNLKWEWFCPDAPSLATFTRAFKEYVGYAVDSLSH